MVEFGASTIDGTAQLCYSLLCHQFQVDEPEIARIPRDSEPTARELRAFWARVHSETDGLVGMQAVLDLVRERVAKRLDDLVGIQYHFTRTSESFRPPTDITPISLLPDELIMNILFEAQTEQHGRFAHPHITGHLSVCRRWYRILTTEGRFWSGFQLAQYAGMSEARFNTPRAIEARLRLARQAPLCISIEEWRETRPPPRNPRFEWTKSCDQQFRLLLARASQWRKVTMRIITPPLWAAMRTGLQTAEAVSLHVVVSDPWAAISPTFSMKAKSLHIEGWMAVDLLAPQRPSIFRHVEDLTVTLWDLHNLCSIPLDFFRRLRRLRVRNSTLEKLPIPAGEFLFPQGCSMPFLTSLTLDGIPEKTCDTTLADINAPVLTDFHYSPSVGYGYSEWTVHLLYQSLMMVGTKWTELTELHVNLSPMEGVSSEVVFNAAPHLRNLRMLDVQYWQQDRGDALEALDRFLFFALDLDSPLRKDTQGIKLGEPFFPHVSTFIMRLRRPMNISSLIRAARSRASSDEVPAIMTVRMFHTYSKGLKEKDRILERSALALYVSEVDAQ